MGRAVLAALPALLVAILVLSAVGVLASAEEQPLAADMDRVFWLSDIARPSPPYDLGGRYFKANNTWHFWRQGITIYFDPRDVPGWVFNSKVYFVVCYAALDKPAGHKTLWLNIYNSMFYRKKVPVEDVPYMDTERCTVSLDVVDGRVLRAGALTVEIAPWAAMPTSDDIVSITITRIGVAPPKGALDSQQQGQPVDAAGHREPMGLRLDGRSVAVAAAGGFALALLAVAVLGRRGR